MVALWSFEVRIPSELRGGITQRCSSTALHCVCIHYAFFWPFTAKPTPPFCVWHNPSKVTTTPCFRP